MVQNWVHKANRQPKTDRNPDHVAVDRTVIQLDAALDPESNKSLDTKLEPKRTKVISSTIIRELREECDASDAVFLINGDHSLNYAYGRNDLDSRYERHGNQNSIKYVFREIKQFTSSLSNFFSNARITTATQWLSHSGSY